MQKQPVFLDVQFRLEDLSRIGDPLMGFNKVIEWEKFNGTLIAARARDGLSRGVGNNTGCTLGQHKQQIRHFHVQLQLHSPRDHREGRSVSGPHSDGLVKGKTARNGRRKGTEKRLVFPQNSKSQLRKPTFF